MKVYNPNEPGLSTHGLKISSLAQLSREGVTVDVVRVAICRHGSCETVCDIFEMIISPKNMGSKLFPECVNDRKYKKALADAGFDPDKCIFEFTGNLKML